MKLVITIVVILAALYILARSNRWRHQHSDRSFTDEDVVDMLREGRNISAIRAYRQIHGVGIREAKEAIERMKKASGIRDPVSEGEEE